MLVIGRSFVHFARTQACETALLGGFTHIFWLDDDAIVSPDLLPKYLLHDKDVIITPYFMRRPPYECGVLKSTTGDFHDHASYRNLTTADLHQGLIEVDGGGTHAMLVRVETLQKRGDNDQPESCDPRLRSFIEKLSPADRDLVEHHVGTLPDETLTMEEENTRGIKPFFIMPKVGTEDMLWCYRAKRKGVKIWCDTDATSGHVGFPPVIVEALCAKAEEMRGLKPGGAAMVRVQPRDITAGSDTKGVSSARHTHIDMALTGSLT
jgi:hypothetical protein